MSNPAKPAHQGQDDAAPVARTWPSDWEARRNGMDCPACSEGRPDRVPDGERFFAGAAGDAYLNRDARSRGYAMLFWRGRHVVELSDLDPGELSSFTSELVRVCRAIETHYRPAKLNLLVLGNGLPHLHVHIVPRFVDDASPGRPPRFMMVDQDWPLIGDEDYRRQLEALRELLAPEAGPGGSWGGLKPDDRGARDGGAPAGDPGPFASDS